jgi:hypothetical protein
MAKFPLWGGVGNLEFALAMGAAQDDLKRTDGAAVTSLDNIVWGLHISLLYECCWTAAQTATALDVLTAMQWTALDLSMAGVSCVVEPSEANNVFVEVRVGDADQVRLMAFVRHAEALLVAAGLPVRPRLQEFHSTIGTVNNSFPTDQWVAAYNASHFDFGRLHFDHFEYAGRTIHATNSTVAEGGQVPVGPSRPRLQSGCMNC